MLDGSKNLAVPGIFLFHVVGRQGDDVMGGMLGFFDFDDRLKRLSDLGDQLESFLSAVDFEIFRADLVSALDYSSGPQGGRPPFDPIMMFKILVIQAVNNLSDERTEFLINDRLSFMRSWASVYLIECRMHERFGYSGRS